MNRIESALKRAGMAPPLEALGQEEAFEPTLDAFPSAAAASSQRPRAQGPEPTSHGPAPEADGPAPEARGLETVAWREEVASAFAEKIVATKGVLPVPVEQYRRLAAALHHAQHGRGIKVVMIASAMPGEGKTLTATNLALTLSESYRRRVLLMDADLRRPMLHHVFRVPNTSGLTDGLAGPVDGKLSVSQLSPRLSLLVAGQPAPDPMGALISERMRRVIDEGAASFDWVILDTPPVGLLPDANLLAAMVDVAVLVVAANRTPFALARKAAEAIGRDRVMGVVLNRAADGAVPGGDYAAYGAYYGARSTPAGRAVPDAIAG